MGRKEEERCEELKDYAVRINGALKTVLGILARDYTGNWHIRYKNKSYGPNEEVEYAVISRDVPREILISDSLIFPAEEPVLVLIRKTRDQTKEAIWKISADINIADDLEKIIKDALGIKGLRFNNEILRVKKDSLFFL